MQCAERRKEKRAKQAIGKKLFPTINATEYNEFLHSNKRLFMLETNETESEPLVLPIGSADNELETYLARVWEDIAKKHVPEMLEDLESLKYVPVQIRKKWQPSYLSLTDTTNRN